MTMDLVGTFDGEIRDLYGRIVRECGGRYHPTQFFHMIETYGGLETAHRLLKDPNVFTYGFQRLCELRRSDLTMGAMILDVPYKDELFSTEELSTAAERLNAGRALYP